MHNLHVEGYAPLSFVQAFGISAARHATATHHCYNARYSMAIPNAVYCSDRTYNYILHVTADATHGAFILSPQACFCAFIRSPNFRVPETTFCKEFAILSFIILWGWAYKEQRHPVRTSPAFVVWLAQLLCVRRPEFLLFVPPNAEIFCYTRRMLHNG